MIVLSPMDKPLSLHVQPFRLCPCALDLIFRIAKVDTEPELCLHKTKDEVELRLFGRVPSSVTTGKQKIVSLSQPKNFCYAVCHFIARQCSVFTSDNYNAFFRKSQQFYHFFAKKMLAVRHSFPAGRGRIVKERHAFRLTGCFRFHQPFVAHAKYRLKRMGNQMYGKVSGLQ